jgi:uncharacterized iron-regulated membrane protein
MNTDPAHDAQLDHEQGRRATPYRAVWRWHFYAGLFAAPVLIILAMTGALYLFDHELDGLLHSRLLRVEPAAQAAGLVAQEAALRAAYPAATLRNVVLPRAPEEAARWSVTLADGRQREVFINPYTLNINGEANPALNPLGIARNLHGNLLTGEVGSHIVELVACWTLVMLVTGLYLWWPRSWRISAFIPRRSGSTRALLRDWHSIPAMLNALLVLFLVLSGMPWSAFWGARFASLGEHLPFIAPSPNFTSKLPASVTGLPWTIQHHGAPSGTPAAQVTIGVVEPVLQRLDMARHGPGAKISYPAGSRGIFLVSYVPARAQGQRTLYVDPADGNLLGDLGWRDYSPTAKVVEWGVMTHMGRQYGLANQLVGLLACLTIVGSVIAGLVLWWQRRPPGRLAAPQRRSGDRLPRFLVVTLCVMGALFPLLGATLIVVWLVDRYAASDRGLGRAMA